MTTTFALTGLYDAVVARFLAEGTEVPNLFGWREPSKRPASGGAGTAPTGTRITWVPGDPDGDLGELGPAKQPGRNPRPLATLAELFTVEVQAHDPSAPENERLQYEAARLLFDAWYRAVYLAAHGTFELVSTQWLNEKNQRRHGACIRAVCAINAMVPDVAQRIAPVDVTAAFTAKIPAQEPPADTETIVAP